MSTMSTSQSGTREVGGAKSGKDKNFAARRVPDFARLHAMEDARVARWKRQHSRKLTVPLAFKLTPAVPQPPALEKAGSENADSRSQNGSRTPRNERDATSSKAPLAVKSGGQKENENKTQHTNGSALAGSGAGDRTSTRVGPPSSHVMYPSAFAPSTGRRPPSTVLAQPINVAARPVSMGVPPAARPVSAPRDTYGHMRVLAPTQKQQQQGPSLVPMAPSQPSETPAGPRPPPNAVPAASSRVQEDVKAAAREPEVPAASSGAYGEGPRADERCGEEGQGQGQGVQQRPGEEGGGEAVAKGPSGAGQGGAGGGGQVKGKSGKVGEEEGKSGGGGADMELLRGLVGSLPVESLTQPFSSMDFYSFGRTLGEGAYGKVKLGTQLLTSQKVAVKTFEKSKLTEPHARKRVAREIRILKALNHPYIIRLYEVVDVPYRKYLIMQYSSGGDLCRYVREHRRLSEQEACRLFVQIVQGLQHCHMSGIVHRDVKLDNLLIDEEKNIKIVDFGFSVSFKPGQKLRKACGSPSYAAPEIVARRPYSPTGVDVWSLGVVLYAMVCGYFPFQGSGNQDLCKRIVKGKFECPSFMSAECKDLIRRMLCVDAAKRATLPECQQHSWCKAAFARQAAANVRIRMIECEKSEDSLDRSTLDEEIEVEEDLLGEMVGLGFRREFVTRCVERNMHNLCCSTYWLLHQKREQARVQLAKGRAAEDGSGSAEAQPTTPSNSNPARRMMV